MTSQQEDLIKRVFQELQDRGLVRSTHHPESYKEDGPGRSPQFHAGTIHFRSIFYRFGNCTFDENSLRFIILHEERHQKGIRDWYAFLFNWVFWTILFVYLRFSWNLQPPWSDLTLLIIIPASWYSSMPFLRMGETRSDLWAARQLKSKLDVPRPSEVVQRALTFPPIERSRLEKLLRRILFNVVFADYHPPLEKRVARIKKEVDDTS